MRDEPIKVVLIEVVKDGKVGYLSGTSCLYANQVTTNPMKALNFFGDEFDLKRTLDSLVVPGDEMYAKSGVRIDELPNVIEAELVIDVKVTSKKQGRDHHKVKKD